MSIYKSVLSCCLFLLMSCTQAEHVEQKTQIQGKHTDTVSEISQSESKGLIPIDKVPSVIENTFNFSTNSISYLLKTEITTIESIQCKDSKGDIIGDNESPEFRTSIHFLGLPDNEYSRGREIYEEVKQLAQEKRVEIKDLESKYLVLNAYSLKKQAKYPIKVRKVGEVYVSNNNKLFEIKLLDGTSAHIEVFKDITYYSIDKMDKDGNIKSAEYHVSEAPEYSPYYFHFWFDGDREKQTCRLKYNVFVD
ncbi:MULTISPECIES: hypothetical protein [unclassified Neisseria]|uniref:hypothetical protein n=1 Tax=unclassified Neisseria TaxID=2623750 RepID=UPI0026655DD4|nr:MULTISPECIES: hypothetical protein [unclassified Neisseria]MDO1510915.1 hypothetical protein [Neisseria sp. MVDL19-042950]MDO1516862.1 hypothetical protein [Neisseria sp. MVDL18-041461]MDO1563926.1 hypothetical protein [Neisseria sp. MVDL20-010259]